MARASKPGEHPLMSNRVLRAMYTSLAATHAHQPTRKQAQSAQADAACWIAPLAGLIPTDIVFGCRPNGLLEEVRPGTTPPIAHPIHRLYAAIGAARASTGKPGKPVILAFFERKEVTAKGWAEALALASPLPLLLVVLPRGKGREDPLDLGRSARASNLPAIPVDAQDCIALYRVVCESITRARAGGGAALLEAVRLEDASTARERLGSYLIARDVAPRSWVDRVSTGRSPK